MISLEKIIEKLWSKEAGIDYGFLGFVEDNAEFSEALEYLLAIQMLSLEDLKEEGVGFRTSEWLSFVNIIFVAGLISVLAVKTFLTTDPVMQALWADQKIIDSGWAGVLHLKVDIWD